MMDDEALGREAEAALLDKALDALRGSGRFVHRLPGARATYFVDDGPPLSTGQVVALAWNAGLMGRSEGMQ